MRNVLKKYTDCHYLCNNLRNVSPVENDHIIKKVVTFYHTIKYDTMLLSEDRLFEGIGEKYIVETIPPPE